MRLVRKGGGTAVVNKITMTYENNEGKHSLIKT